MVKMAFSISISNYKGGGIILFLSLVSGYTIYTLYEISKQNYDFIASQDFIDIDITRVYNTCANIIIPGISVDL